MSSIKSMSAVASVGPKPNLQSQSSESPVHTHVFMNTPSPSCDHCPSAQWPKPRGRDIRCAPAPSSLGSDPTPPRASHAVQTVVTPWSMPPPAHFSSTFSDRGGDSSEVPFPALSTGSRRRPSGERSQSLQARATMPKAWACTHTRSRAPQGSCRSCKCRSWEVPCTGGRFLFHALFLLYFSTFRYV